MPVVTFDYEDFISLLGKKIKKEEMLKKIPMIGAEIEKVDGNEISVEFFPDRPDLLSIEGIARAMRSFLEIELGMKKYEVMEPKIEMKVEESVKEVRPYVSAAIIRNVKMTDELVASVMELQEKLHLSIGKERKKMAIGVHNLDAVVPPFTYKGVKPNEIKFVPLGKAQEMNLEEILLKHEKGIKYAHLLEGKKLYPIIVDKNENVLSFPPIINGELTAVDLYTENIFIDVTGTEKMAVENALNIIATAFAERGGKLEKVKIIDEERRVTPNLIPEEREVDINYASKILGMDVKKYAVKSLQKMGYDAFMDGDMVKVKIPPWRVDILHAIDLVEDMAIGYGYEKFQPKLPEEMTFGKGVSFRKLHDILLGLGFIEVVTLSLSNKEDQFQKMNVREKEIVEIENPVTTKHSCLRLSLLPSLLEILSKNKHNELPQAIYEIGEVVDIQNKMAKNFVYLAGVKISAKTGFTECKSLVEAIMRNLGIDATIKEKKHDSFIEGRCASIWYDGEIGYFGELHPMVIINFELEHPIIAFEMNVEKLLSLSEEK
ncbi:phenylalanine--tRNA ligase subunit beta [Thermoplasmatales archaeon ex4484_30]|nr:MAG: phenylalanine--tRNA ligase subunit beta [Thermoplasmatales archaeon ex4484_30]